jgi:hypothetical protein
MIDRVNWSHLFPRLRQTWKQGEHALACAPTGRGKTVLIRELVTLRANTVFMGTKSYDEEYERYITHYGFRRVTMWPPAPYIDRVMLWPKPRQSMAETRVVQRAVFAKAINDIFRRGKWTVVFDELHWLTNALRLGDDIAHMHHQGRSSKLTFIDGFQRPAFVPVIVYSSATHVFAWGTNSKKDLDTLQSIAKLDGMSRRDLANLMGSLEKHEFVYVNTADTHPPVISKVDL